MRHIGGRMHGQLCAKPEREASTEINLIMPQTP